MTVSPFGFSAVPEVDLAASLNECLGLFSITENERLPLRTAGISSK
jgi:hypothetical protein